MKKAFCTLVAVMGLLAAAYGDNASQAETAIYTLDNLSQPRTAALGVGETLLCDPAWVGEASCLVKEGDSVLTNATEASSVRWTPTEPGQTYTLTYVAGSMVWTATFVSITGNETLLYAVDNLPQPRLATPGVAETLVYDPAWGGEATSCEITDNGAMVTNATESGTHAWLPTVKARVHELTNVVGGVILSASFRTTIRDTWTDGTSWDNGTLTVEEDFANEDGVIYINNANRDLTFTIPWEKLAEVGINNEMTNAEVFEALTTVNATTGKTLIADILDSFKISFDLVDIKIVEEDGVRKVILTPSPFEANRIYKVMYRDDLTTGSWTALEPDFVSGDGSNPAFITIDIDGAVKGFFKSGNPPVKAGITQ